MCTGIMFCLLNTAALAAKIQKTFLGITFVDTLFEWDRTGLFWSDKLFECHLRPKTLIQTLYTGSLSLSLSLFMYPSLSSEVHTISLSIRTTTQGCGYSPSDDVTRQLMEILNHANNKGDETSDSEDNTSIRGQYKEDNNRVLHNCNCVLMEGFPMTPHVHLLDYWSFRRVGLP